jgi:predicted CoA-binding protein
MPCIVSNERMKGDPMDDAEAILRATRSILVVDWPSRDVPDTLAAAGYDVVVKGGPADDDYSSYKIRDGRIEIQEAAGRPTHADLVYVYRPLDELPDLVALARELGTRTVWLQSGRTADHMRDPHACWMSDDSSAEARRIVEAAGLTYLDQPYIADVVRSLPNQAATATSG